MKLVLVALIALAQVAGPLPCCCRPVAAAPVTAAPVPEPVCPHCSPVAAETTAPALPNPAPAGCPRGSESMPCCQWVLASAALPTSDAAVWEQLLVLADWSLVWPTGDFRHAPDSNLARWRAGVTDLPFLTTSERLYAHHALLC